MDISLIHAGLAAGAALAALPVILHLFMKQTPKHVIFPALRLIRERQKRSRKKLRVKNWLLLLARMALVALMALAPGAAEAHVADHDRRPGGPHGASAWSSTRACRWATSRRTRPGSTRPRSAACEILKKMPDTSHVFVIDSAEPGRPRRSRPPRRGSGSRPDPPQREPDAERGGRPGLHRGRRDRQARATRSTS